ncbi:sigma-70 family RNA polymerase sigma factor [Bacillus sp. Bva_UNVM-123]|uniref:sigma-70 family RNA polymerase sigma factor n=1 Tax=Bacillus sp. Bva_UNVM-123 TaxID=2829798 RepID=UPI00391F1B6C
MDLDEVYQLYVNDLYRYLFSLSKDHYTAEDLVQEAFYRAYIQLEEYEISNIKAWLFKVAYHAFIDFTRKNKRITLSDDIQEKDQDLRFNEKTPENQLLEKESFFTLMNDIHSLKEMERHALILSDLHQLTLKEVAEILELNLNTLKSHLSRGRRKVIERVKERRKQDEERK